jgi:hypothetical protein
MSNPFDPPSFPAPLPPPAPRPNFWGRQSKVRKGLMIGGGVLASLVIIGAVAGGEPAEQAEAPESTTTTVPTTTAVPTTIATTTTTTIPPTTTVAPTTTAPPTTVVWTTTTTTVAPPPPEPELEFTSDDISMLAVDMVWNDMSVLEQLEMCNGYNTVGPELTAAMIATDMEPGQETDDLVDAFLIKFEEECS